LNYQGRLFFDQIVLHLPYCRAMNLYPLLKPLLFAQDPEAAHKLAFAAMGFAGGALLGPLAPSKTAQRKGATTLAGLAFKNRIGLAAGFDKNALQLNAWAKLGFGHVEIGTVTPKPQPGNPKPRLFRLVEDNALLNRMGFNNDGAEAIAKRLQNRPSSAEIIVGGNIGKNKDTSEETAYIDYLKCIEALHDGVDYFTINISSPNTQGLRNLQSKEPLLKLLSEIQLKNQGLAKPKPIFVKIAPDLQEADIVDIVDVATATGMAGLVATNTTLSRSNLFTNPDKVTQLGAGGISGAPLRQQSQYICELLSTLIPKNMVLIASGGIMHGQDVEDRRAVGADLVQLYTGFVYHGPALVKDALLVG
jgi:dihydroorotate dehydrogenase